MKERKAQLIQSKKGLVECASKVAQTAIKYGVEVAKSCDPLAAAIALGGRSGVGVSLSHFSASQCAGIVGIIVTSITPQVRTKNIWIKKHNKFNLRFPFPYF